MGAYILHSNFWQQVIMPFSKSPVTRENFTQPTDTASVVSKLRQEIKALTQAIQQSAQSPQTVSATTTTASRPTRTRHPIMILLGIIFYLFALALFMYLLFFTIYYITVCPNIPKLSYVVVLLFLIASSPLAFVFFLAYMFIIIYLGSRDDCRLDKRNHTIPTLPDYVREPTQVVKKMVRFKKSPSSKKTKSTHVKTKR